MRARLLVRIAAFVSAPALILALVAAHTPDAALRSATFVDNGLARTPPMGWNSWNHFGCNVSEQLIEQTADAMVSSGMRDAGYRYVVIDDCWQVARDANGTLVADSVRFPHGIKALADYVHRKGLKFGIYTDAGTNTCQGRPGTLGHEEQDARTFAAWGVDYVKEDWCHASGLDAPTQYAKFRDALGEAGRPIVFSICEWGSNQPWEWAPKTGNLWRTTDDIEDTWSSMLANLDQSAEHSTVAGPGHWNDPDMLEVGNGGMTDDEYRAHMSLWAIMAAPLIAGNDVRTMSAATKAILENPEVIAVDQDSLGAQGILVWEPRPELQVWAKPLADGSRAVAMLNRSNAPAKITAYISRTGLHVDSVTVRDLWAHANRGTFGREYSTTVPAHAAVMLRVTPVRTRS
ncbi:MAG TPA: glycoside hydrolase family 27 protein [Gemmatimonadaceae bacterium]|nr:glycoside hydrolase family 27 protein [Gemmatimonadaceae bacterium]